MTTPDSSFISRPNHFEVPLADPNTIIAEQATAAAGAFEHIALAGVSAVMFGLQAKREFVEAVHGVPLLDADAAKPNRDFLQAFEEARAGLEAVPRDSWSSYFSKRNLVYYGMQVVAIAAASNQLANAPSVQIAQGYPHEGMAKLALRAEVPAGAQDDVEAIFDVIEPVRELRLGYTTYDNGAQYRMDRLYLTARSGDSTLLLGNEGLFATLSVDENSGPHPMIAVQYASGEMLAGGLVGVDGTKETTIADLAVFARGMNLVANA